MNIDIDEKEKKKRYRWQIAFTTAFILVIIGSSLAVFFTKKSGSPFNLNSKQLVDITYAAGDTLKLTNNAPIFPENMESEATSFEFTINNPNTFAVYASINLDNISMSSSLKTYDFKWALYDGDTKLTTGTFLDAGTTLNMYNNSVIDASSSKTYTVRVWLNETLKEQSLQSTSFSSNVKVTAYSKKLNTLAGKILTSGTKYMTSGPYEYVNCNSSCVSIFGTNKGCYLAGGCESRTEIPIVYSELDKTIYTTPTNTEADIGLFVQSEDSTKSNFGFPTYYYSGEIENNYVSFGTYKTTDGSNTVGNPIIWRIVRINEDGSIRLLSQNAIGSTTSKVGGIYTGSVMESTINTWYNNNIGSNSGTTLDNLVQTGNFCNDISDTFYTRKTSNTHTFTCPDGGVMINSKAGTITADEIIFTSGFDNEQSYMTMTSMSLPDITNIWSTHYQSLEVDFNELIDYSKVYYRIVINLKPDVIVKSGNGSSTNPYIIKN